MEYFFIFIKILLLPTCLNCGTAASGKFCHECGQKLDIRRLNTKALLHEVGHFFTHIDHYFLRTTIAFILRPGSNSLYYLHGKRKKYQKPVSFFLIWAGLYILLHNLIINYFHFSISAEAAMLQSHEEKANELLRSHFTLFFLPVIFTSSVVIYFVLGKPRLFYAEVLTLCLYGAGCFNAMLILVDLGAGVLFHININSVPVFLFQTIISALYNFWFCYDLFRRMKTKFLWWRLLLTAILISIIGWVIFLYAPLAWIVATR